MGDFEVGDLVVVVVLSVGEREALEVGFLEGKRVGGLLLVGEDEEDFLDGERVLVLLLVGEEVCFLVGAEVDLVDAEENDAGDFEAGR